MFSTFPLKRFISVNLNGFIFILLSKISIFLIKNLLFHLYSNFHEDFHTFSFIIVLSKFDLN